MRDVLPIRIHGDPALPTVIYLPGLHGDWLLVTRFRLAVAGRVRFVEFTYPNTVTWSVADFAAAVAEQLRAHGIVKGWVLAESFGSQVAWELLGRSRREEAPGNPIVQSGVNPSLVAAAATSYGGREKALTGGEQNIEDDEEKCASSRRRLPGFEAEGLILAGGFVRHPWPVAVRVTEWLLRRLPLGVLTAVVSGYAVAARWRFKQDPEVMVALREFRARWGEPLRRAAAHRTHLVALNDPRPLARAVRVPVFALTGAWDPVVPWPPVRRWLRRECPGWRGGRVVWSADHNVLGTGTAAAAEQVLGWLGG
jgi:pimeloyl-ACP methyl ester carboxylesterase